MALRGILNLTLPTADVLHRHCVQMGVKRVPDGLARVQRELQALMNTGFYLVRGLVFTRVFLLFC